MAGTQTIRRIGILTGGGDCPGLNAVIRAVTKSAIFDHGLEVYGVEDGYLGLIENRMRPLAVADVSSILDRGGTILGTSNKASPDHYCVGRDAHGKPIFRDVTRRVVHTVAERGLDVLVCIGGDGTMSAASRLVENGLRVVGIPKTIDNDLMHTDVTFGFDTAVATASEAMDRIRTTAASHHRVMFVETMGRNTGWIALFAGAASGADLILLPEIPFDLDTACACCEKRHRVHKVYTLVSVAEGAVPVGGRQVIERVVHESVEPVRLGGVSEVLAKQIAGRTGLETRATILGHVQRGGKPTAHDRVLATRFGWAAVEMIGRGEFNRMVAMRNGGLTSVPLSDVADRERKVPLDHPVLQACRATGVVFGD